MSSIQAHGIHSMWGMSSAKNLCSMAFDNLNSRVFADDSSEDSLNILLLNPGDPRHIMRTISERKRFGDRLKRPMHFYILEEANEVLARHLLLLRTFMDWSIPIRHRASLFLEIFGNSSVQERTEKYIESSGASLIQCIHQGEGNLANVVDLSNLKSRDRDSLESIFKSWNVSVPFDVVLLRDQRLRQYYGDRYDCRKHVIDWDYYSRVRNVASIIHMKQFRNWRLTGVAFEFGDATYSAPNRSCSSFAGGLKRWAERGSSKEDLGYWLDILVGPYVSFGVNCDRIHQQTDADNLFHVVNKGTGTEQHLHHAVEVAMYNVMSMIWEIEVSCTRILFLSAILTG